MKMLEKDKRAMTILNISKPYEVNLETDAFSRMHQLRLLQVNYLQLIGGYKEFSKNLRWLCWHGCPLKFVPSDFPVENLIAIEMGNSKLEQLWKEAKVCYFSFHVFFGAFFFFVAFDITFTIFFLSFFTVCWVTKNPGPQTLP